MRKALLVLSLVILVVSVSRAATLEALFDRTFDVRPGTLFAVSNQNGRIIVRSWDVPRVQVHAVKRAESRDSGEAKRVLDAITIIPTATAGALRIETRLPRRNDGVFDWIAGTSVNMTVLYDITVPRSMNVQIDNTNGSIRIEDVRGSLRASNTNGRIDCAHCGGEIDAETTNGPVRVELAEVKPNGSIRLESTNGRISIVLPKSAAVRVDASTTNGSIDSDLPVSATNRHSNELRGTINGGGAELRLRTTNGGITIESR